MSAVPFAVTAADEVAAKLGMAIRAEPGDWPLVLSRYSCVAVLESGSERIEGFGCAPTAPVARERAIMECLERYAQFQCAPPPMRSATGAYLGQAALSPESFGLYAPDQYEAPGFPFAPYSPHAMLEWVEVADASTRQPRYLPAEFVYPHIAVARKPLVAETSSGTAAHHCKEAALMGALCEAIERDSLLMFWHRQPPTAAIAIDSSISAEAAADLENIRALGFLTVVCRIEYDLHLPCILALALRGDRFAWGAGCHPCLNKAVEQAVRELGNLMRWQVLQSGAARTWVNLSQVSRPCHHYALYDGGPFHHVLRRTLDNTIRDGVPLPAPAGTDTLAEALRGLVDQGYRVYECDLTPSEVRSCGVVVTRALAPGLIPLYFGYDRIRLGCRRLWSRDAPGRFHTLLPHFMT